MLGVDPAATHVEIKQAFRVLSVKTHPLKTQDKLSHDIKEFNSVCEAFEVLSDTQLKLRYDTGGKSGL